MKSELCICGDHILKLESHYILWQVAAIMTSHCNDTMQVSALQQAPSTLIDAGAITAGVLMLPGSWCVLVQQKAGSTSRDLSYKKIHCDDIARKCAHQPRLCSSTE